MPIFLPLRILDLSPLLGNSVSQREEEERERERERESVCVCVSIKFVDLLDPIYLFQKVRQVMVTFILFTIASNIN
jgi:hypothetical protein